MRAYKPNSQPLLLVVRQDVAPTARRRRANPLSVRDGHPISAARSSYMTRNCAEVKRPERPATRVRMWANLASSGSLWVRSSVPRRVTERTDWQAGQVIFVMLMTVSDTSEPVKCHTVLHNVSPIGDTSSLFVTHAQTQTRNTCHPLASVTRYALFSICRPSRPLRGGTPVRKNNNREKRNNVSPAASR